VVKFYVVVTRVISEHDNKKEAETAESRVRLKKGEMSVIVTDKKAKNEKRRRAAS
jgi:hypothetical protein